MTVKEGGCVATENPALERLSEAEMGALIFHEMTQLAQNNDSDTADRVVVETELWRLYLLAKGRG